MTAESPSSRANASSTRSRHSPSSDSWTQIGTALTVAYVVVSIELVAIAWVRKRFLHVSMRTSLIQVTLGGVVIASVGVLLGHA